MTGTQRVELPCVFDRQDIPLAIAEIIFCKVSKCFARVIGAVGFRNNHNSSAAALYPLVELDILIADKPFIEISVFFKNVAFPTTERHGIHLSRTVNPGAEGRIANSEWVGQHLLYCQ